jgi:uncharacterized protein YoxC
MTSSLLFDKTSPVMSQPQAQAAVANQPQAAQPEDVQQIQQQIAQLLENVGEISQTLKQTNERLDRFSYKIQNM